MAVALVLEDEVLHGVIGYDEVGEPIGVEIHGHHAERLGRGHPGGRIGDLHAALLANVGEAAAAVVAVEVREGTLEIHGRTVSSGGSVDLVAHLGVDGAGPVHIAGHEHVEVAVVVEVEPGGRGAPFVRTATHAGRCGDVLEVSAPLIVEEVSPTHGGDQHVGLAVVVVVTHRRTHAVEWRLQAGSGRDVGEADGAANWRVVAVQGATGRGWPGIGPRPAVAIDQKQVGIAVSIRIEEGRAGSHGFGQQLFAGGSREMTKLDPCRRAHLGERHLGQGEFLGGLNRLWGRQRRHLNLGRPRVLAQRKEGPGSHNPQSDQGDQRPAQSGADGAVIGLDPLFGFIRALRILGHVGEKISGSGTEVSDSAGGRGLGGQGDAGGFGRGH